MTLNLGTRLEPFDFEEEGFDAAIHFGAANWAGAGAIKLFDERLVACSAPGFLAPHPVGAARDMIGLPLLQLETRPNGLGELVRPSRGRRAECRRACSSTSSRR